MIHGPIDPVDNHPLIDVELDERKGRLHILVKEDVTSTHVPEFRSAVARVLELHGKKSWKSLYLDLRGCRMIDSMGLNWLYAETMRLREAKREMVVRISSPAIQRVIEFSGLNRLVTLKYRRRKQTR